MSKVGENRKFNRKIRKEKAITLIALVITIIVLLILAGVTVATITGDNGILNNAAEAKNKTEETQEKESLELAIISGQMEGINTLEIDKEKLENAIKQQFGNSKDFSVTDNRDGSFLVNMNDTQRMYYIDETGEVIDQNKILKISTVNELKAFRDDVNSGNTYEGWYVYLANDITLDINEEWEPIGIYQQNSTNPEDEINIRFKGVFDGKFNKIIGLHTSDELSARGLFGLIKDSTIKNVGIVDGNIQGTSRTGAIVGYAYNNSKIINCYNTSNVSTSNNYIGGIAGFIKDNTIIKNCYNNGNIRSTEGSNIGGIVGGLDSGVISNCYNTGMVEGEYVGGISGGVYNKALIENCYTVGDLKTGGSLALSINCASNKLVILKNNYYLQGSVNESNDIYPQEECKCKSREEMMSLYNVLGTSFREDKSNINNGYPILYWQYY